MPNEYKRYNISLKIRDEKYLDMLLVSLARQGYDVYIGENDNDHGRNVSFQTSIEEVHELKD